MKISRVLVYGVGALALGLVGCPQRGPSPDVAGRQEGAMAVALPPLAYTPAREGLPTTRIWKSQMAFGDINGDGHMDLGAMSRLADGPWIFAGDGQGNWTAAANGLPREPFCGGGMDFADVNNDGKMDVGIADHCKGVYVFLGDGEGNWKSASSGLPSIGAEDVALGDFDNDGCADLVSVAAAEEGVRAFRGDCTGVWGEASDGLALTEWGNAVELADMNGDGNLDVAAAYSAGPRVWLGDGKGGWREASEGLPAPDIHGLYWGVAVGDLTGDGKLDVVSGSTMPPQPEGCGSPGAPTCVGGGVEAFIQEEDGSWRFANEGFLPMNALGVDIGDLNNDGHMDVVVVGKRVLDQIGGVYGVFPYLGDGSGKWQLHNATGLPNNGRMRTWGVKVADIDSDGVLDLGVAFGDVMHPGWRSGSKRADGAGTGGPRRGQFGSLEVWRGRLTVP